MHRPADAYRRSFALVALVVGLVGVGVGVVIGLLAAPSNKTASRTVIFRRPAPRRRGTVVPPVSATYAAAGFLSATDQRTGASIAAGSVTRALGGNVRMGVSIQGHPFAVLGKVTLQPGAQTGWHIHPRGLDGFILVVRGTITFYVAPDPRCTPHPLSPGQVAFIAGTREHDIRNEGSTPATLYALSFFGRPVSTRNAFLPQPKSPSCPF